MKNYFYLHNFKNEYLNGIVWTEIPHQEQQEHFKPRNAVNFKRMRISGTNVFLYTLSYLIGNEKANSNKKNIQITILELQNK